MALLRALLGDRPCSRMESNAKKFRLKQRRCKTQPFHRIRGGAFLVQSSAMKPSRVLVTGVSGPIGAALLPLLKQQGCEVTRLVRGQVKGENQIAWDPSKPVAPETVTGF